MFIIYTWVKCNSVAKQSTWRTGHILPSLVCQRPLTQAEPNSASEAVEEYNNVSFIVWFFCRMFVENKKRLPMSFIFCPLLRKSLPDDPSVWNSNDATPPPPPHPRKRDDCRSRPDLRATVDILPICHIEPCASNGLNWFLLTVCYLRKISFQFVQS